MHATCQQKVNKKDDNLCCYYMWKSFLFSTSKGGCFLLYNLIDRILLTPTNPRETLKKDFKRGGSIFGIIF